MAVYTGELQIYNISATPATVAVGEYFDLKAKVKNVSGKEMSFSVAVYWGDDEFMNNLRDSGFSDEEIPMFLLLSSDFEDGKNIKTVTLAVNEEAEVTFRPSLGKEIKYRLAIALYDGDMVSLAYACATRYMYEFWE